MWCKAAFVFVTFNKVVPPNIFSFLLPGTALYYYRLTNLAGEKKEKHQKIRKKLKKLFLPYTV
jgi:hypothetical protein